MTNPAEVIAPTTPACAPGAGSSPALPPACARCGHDAELDLATMWLCIDCYHVAGSTCAGVGRVDSSPDPVC